MAEWRRQAGCCGRLLAILGGILFTALANAQPLDERLLIDAADGELNDHDFVAAALIAGGTADGSELARWRQAYEKKAVKLGLPLAGSVKERLSAIQMALHEQFLTGRYVAIATDLRTTIARGDYNCLTALAIHWDLCRRAGLSLEICAQPGHVHLLLANGIAVEPGTRQSLGQLRSASGRDTRQLTVVELLGKFYYNRGVEQLCAGRFEAGVALLETSLRLDPADADASENLAAGLNNWAVEHCRRERYDLAAPLIAQGLSIEPTFAPLVTNERLVRGRLQKAD
jgi:hypothetical protein